MARITDYRQRLCALTALVSERVFNWTLPADCWCMKGSHSSETQVDDSVIEFIESAVYNAVEAREPKHRANAHHTSPLWGEQHKEG